MMKPGDLFVSQGKWFIDECTYDVFAIIDSPDAPLRAVLVLEVNKHYIKCFRDSKVWLLSRSAFKSLCRAG